MPQYFFMLAALDKHTGNQHEQHGTIIPAPGSTRLSVLTNLLTAMAERNGHSPQRYMPVLFTLEPNDLSAPAPVPVPAAL